MTTFSQIVDELVTELIRPDLRDSIARYLNQTLREVHFDEKTEMPVYYGSNRLEEDVTFVTNPAVWMIPTIPRFQAVETIYLPNHCEYARQRPLRRVFDSEDKTQFFWYRTGPSIAIGGVAPITAAKLSWFEYVGNLQFFKTGQRPVLFDSATGDWAYQTVDGVDWGATTESRLAALEMSTNWLLLRWTESIKAGVRNKVYIRLGEDVRARTTYSIYSTARKQIINSESLNTESYLS